MSPKIFGAVAVVLLVAVPSWIATAKPIHTQALKPVPATQILADDGTKVKPGG